VLASAFFPNNSLSAASVKARKANPRRGSAPTGACKWMTRGKDLENLGVAPRTAR
jgi:hypothetical protein